MKLRCRICEQEKALCLFTPREARSKYPKCRQCVRDDNTQNRAARMGIGSKAWSKNMTLFFQK